MDQEEIDAQIAAAFTGSKKKKKKVVLIEEPTIVDDGTNIKVTTTSFVSGFNPSPVMGTIQDGVTSVLNSLNIWNSNYYQGTVLYSETAGTTITFGQLCYRTQSETWELADATTANAAAAFNMLGICVKSSTSTNPTSILINGFVETTTYTTVCYFVCAITALPIALLSGNQIFNYTARRTINSLILPIALFGFNPFGQTSTQFIIE